MQLLSIVDISISITTTVNAIARGTLDRRSLLDKHNKFDLLYVYFYVIDFRLSTIQLNINLRHHV